MKPKDWLLANGHIKEITRGRMSREHIALIEQAVRDGEQIDGYAVSTAVRTPADTPTPPKVEKVAKPSERIADVPDETRPESSWEAYTYYNGAKKDIGMRTVCNTCGNSLTYCPCRTPMVNLDDGGVGLVSFKVRTKPLPTTRW